MSQFLYYSYVKCSLASTHNWYIWLKMKPLETLSFAERMLWIESFDEIIL